MHALRFDATGSLEGLYYRELPAAPLAEGELRVEVRAAGLNPSDVKNVLGRFPYTTLPRTPGRDFAGVVVEGEAAWLGQEVWGTGKELGFTRDGSHASHLMLPATGVARKPRSLSFEQAASCGVPFTTAWDALERTGVVAGTRLAIVGAGAVGRAARDLAMARGAAVLTLVRRPEQAEELRQAGWKAVALRSGSPLGESVREGHPPGAEVIFDTTGAWLGEAVAALSPFGRIAVIAAPATGLVPVPILDLYRRGGTIVGINSLLYDSAHCAVTLNRLGELFDAGRLTPPTGLTPITLSGGVQAYRRVEAGTADKVVLRPGGASGLDG